MVERLAVESAPPPFALVGRFLLDHALLRPYVIAYHQWNTFAGETQAQAAKRCSMNLAPGASNYSKDRYWPNLLPTFSPWYARFRNDSPLITRVRDRDLPGITLITCARSQDPTLGTTSNDRATVGGSYGSSSTRGFSFEFSALNQGRSIDVATNAPTSLVTCAASLGTETVDKWRIWYASSGSALACRNLKGAFGSVGAPSPVTLSGGRIGGEFNYAIGGRQVLAGGTNYAGGVHKDIAWSLLIADEIPYSDTADINALLAQQDKLLAETNGGIILGAV